MCKALDYLKLEHLFKSFFFPNFEALKKYEELIKYKVHEKNLQCFSPHITRYKCEYICARVTM